KKSEEVIVCKPELGCTAFVIQDIDDRQRVSFDLGSDQAAEFRFETDILKAHLHRFLESTAQSVDEGSIVHARFKTVFAGFDSGGVIHLCSRPAECFFVLEYFLFTE